VLEGEGRLQEYVGGYDDWLRQRADVNTQPKPAGKETKTKKEKQPKEKSKLSFKETKELEELPRKIEKMEKEKEQLVELLNSADLYKTNNPSRVLDVNHQLTALEAALETAYARWDELEEMAAKFPP
jgi:ATP-binding cassette subfamily F protein uup